MAFTRSFFAFLGLLFTTTYMFACPFGSSTFKWCTGIGLGILFSLLLFTLDRMVKKCSLRSFVTITLGLCVGYVIGTVVTSIFAQILRPHQIPEVMKDAISTLTLLLSTYLGIILTIRSTKEIPFPEMQTKKEGLDLHVLSTAIKSPVQAGDTLKIKIQRYGKEARQGVGYLDDGTMIVVNNGGDFLGEIIETQVISVKQTSAGRIIFTNAMTEQFAYDA